MFQSMCLSAVSCSSEGGQEWLLCSHSRVASVKKITLPTLEICGAALLVELFDRILHVVECRDK